MHIMHPITGGYWPNLIRIPADTVSMSGTAEDGILGKRNPFDTKKMDSTTMRLYWVILAMSIATVVLGLLYSSIWDVIVSLSVVVVMIATMKHDSKFVHIPPVIIIMIFICLIFSTVGKVFGEYGIMNVLQDVFLGMLLSLFGFICAYISLGKIPGFSDEKPSLISLEAFTFGVALYSIYMMIIRYISGIITGTPDYKEMFDSMAYVTFGSLFISLLFYIDKKSLFAHTVFNFMYTNQEALGVKSENERMEIEHLISRGESDTLEFKSTLRTNLKTGEKDKRMEKAVLKSITAFLNSDGGTLLVGVADDGTILGIDEESFDNRDKLNLHMTNLISSQIGDDYLPYIRFKLISFGENDEKAVMKVMCKTSPIPVFLKDGKTEQYYVRSGPSSVELLGSDMIRYIGRKQSVRKLKVRAGIPHAVDEINEE